MLLALLALTANAYAAPIVVTLTAAPNSGTAPLSVGLSWSSSGATSCTASGGWTGAKALIGSQAISNVMSTTTFSLTCSASSAQATVSWNPPTTNTDGSALVDLASYKLFHAATSAGVPSATPITIIAPASSYVLTGLPAGARYVGLKAVNAQGAESVMSALASKSLVVASAVADATVTVNTVPNPPTLVTVQTAAYELKQTGTMLGKNVGTVPLGVACGVNAFGDYYEIPKSAITFTNTKTNAKRFVAQCG